MSLVKILTDNWRMMRQENRQAGLKHKEISKMSVEKKIIG
jgi:hypothetical protein